MKTAPIVPARWRHDEPSDEPATPPTSLDRGTPIPAHGDLLSQATHVFIAGNGLPQRWRGRERFVVLETGFGLGHNFLATWDAWRHDARACRQLHFISIEPHPLLRADLQHAHSESPWAELAQTLAAAWPPLTPNLHRLSFDGGRVQLLLALGEVGAWLPELVASVDAFSLGGPTAAQANVTWQQQHFKSLARLAAPGATVAASMSTSAMHVGWASAGFDARLAPGPPGHADITLATLTPRAFAPRRPDARRAAAWDVKAQHRATPDTAARPTAALATSASPAPRASDAAQAAAAPPHAVIVGAGLAGCAAACALAEQGWHTTLLDRHAEPTQEASGNPAGLFHGIVNRQDGVHARFNRTAALEAERAVRAALADPGVPGSVGGLLRLDPQGQGIDWLRRELAATGLPTDYVQAVSAEQASALSGMSLPHAGWFFPGGGWVAPGALAAALLARAGAATGFRGGVEVASIRPGEGGGWMLFDVRGKCIAAAPTVVLANAIDALRLLGEPFALAWPVQSVRGQISLLPAGAQAALLSQRELASPRVPLTGAGYLLPRVGATWLFGATAHAGDGDATVRHADHVHNLAQLARLTGASTHHVDPASLGGRTAWRMVSRDRLPIIGAVPDAAAMRGVAGPEGTAPSRPPDQPRFVPRLPGLFVFTALGSRGITWAPLGAQVLASSITGAPQPLEADLLDALDPARFIVRAARRGRRVD
ncbi:MAG: hypothetical protein AD742_15950 [Methylibium sp. NZG]|nr:MAG: hypothetical protein AD742_15950 [Methylibium sp. NZG]